MGFPSEKLKLDFPILRRRICNHNLTYLDSAASSQKPIAVIDAMSNFLKMSYANIHRGIYTIAEEATEEYEKTRKKVADFIHAKTEREIIFTRGTTESINLIRFAWGNKNIGEGDEILLTEMEHHSNLVPWQLLAKEKGARLKFIPFDKTGQLELDKLPKLLTEKTKIVALTYVSNMFGTISPVETIIKAAHQRGIPVLLDGAQAVPHMPVDVQKLDCDFMAFSAHKMLGPTGIGVLYAKTTLLENMDPFMGGGEMIKTVEWEHSTWNDIPWKFEAGTQSIAEAVGLAAGIDYLNKVGMQKIHEHNCALTRYCMEKLPTIEGIQMYGPPAEKREGLLSFNVQGIHPHDVAAILDRSGVAVRAGHHCTQPLHRKLGIDASVRASFYLYNSPEDVDVLLEAIKEAKRVFKL